MTNFYNPDELDVHSQHFIDGQWTDGGDEHIAVIRPSDLREQGQLSNGSAKSIDLAVGAARTAFKKSVWATKAPRERAAILGKWAGLIDKHAEELARLESAVSCRVYHEVVARDVRVVANCLRFFAEYSDKVDGRVTATSEDVLSLTLSEP